jgi:ubiquinone/menaquinone biosynthesis C-methylase UbiE
VLAWLDRWVLRGPFEGRAAARYSAIERPAFGELDGRVLAAAAADLASARVLLDVGAGAGELARRAAVGAEGSAGGLARRDEPLLVVALEPSRAFSRSGGPPRLRAAAEALPLADGAVDVAICLSSLRHARDRVGALRELRRVVRPGGAAWIVEVDRAAAPARVRRHVRAMPSAWSRAAFRLVVLPVCPAADRFAELAREAGWRTGLPAADPEQPFFLLRLS